MSKVLTQLRRWAPIAGTVILIVAEVVKASGGKLSPETYAATVAAIGIVIKIVNLVRGK